MHDRFIFFHFSEEEAREEKRVLTVGLFVSIEVKAQLFFFSSGSRWRR
jgi:hypothetical protein